MEINSIILAAGKGTRMKSAKPKVVQTILAVEMINLVLKNLSAIGIKNNNVVVGYEQQQVKDVISAKVNYINQEQQLGTGDAIICAKKKMQDLEGITLITCGDTPIVSSETYQKLIDYHLEHKNDLTLLTTKVAKANGYGRIIRNNVDDVLKIVEEKDATAKEKKIDEINTGIYCFDNQKLFKYIDLLDSDNAQQEYYLTDMINIFKQKKQHVGAYLSLDSEELIGVNDLVSLSKASKILQQRINYNHLINGVKIIDPDHTYIGIDVQIGSGTIIEPNNSIFGETIIGENSYLKMSNIITDSKIADNCEIGPMTHLRNGAKIANQCRIGNFVEIKNSTLAKNSKVAHLTYLGDARIGNNVNIGCGVITANYDGVNKHQTIIGNNVFVGSNCNLIAPIKLGDNAIIAAGSTVTDDVEADKFVIARKRQEVKTRRKNEK